MALDVTPTAIDPATQTGAMTVEMTIPAMHVRKGEMMLRLGLGMPGQARAHRVTAITATDSRGAIALEAPSGMVAEWHAPRDVEGDVQGRQSVGEGKRV